MGPTACGLAVPSQIIRTPLSTKTRSRPPGRQAFVLTAGEPTATGGRPGACTTKAGDAASCGSWTKAVRPSRSTIRSAPVTSIGSTVGSAAWTEPSQWMAIGSCGQMRCRSRLDAPGNRKAGIVRQQRKRCRHVSDRPARPDIRRKDHRQGSAGVGRRIAEDGVAPVEAEPDQGAVRQERRCTDALEEDRRLARPGQVDHRQPRLLRAGRAAGDGNRQPARIGDRDIVVAIEGPVAQHRGQRGQAAIVRQVPSCFHSRTSSRSSVTRTTTAEPDEPSTTGDDAADGTGRTTGALAAGGIEGEAPAVADGRAGLSDTMRRRRRSRPRRRRA